MIEETDALVSYQFEKEHSNVDVPVLDEARVIQTAYHIRDM